MYVWVWRHLPGNVAIRALLSLAIMFGVLYLLFEQFFPWVDPRLPWNKVAPEGIVGQ